MLKAIVLALSCGIVAAIPIPDPVALGATFTTTHHSSASASAAHHHHPAGYGFGMGYTMGAYPGVVKHTETVSSAAAAYPATSSLTYSAYGAYPGLGGLGYGGYSGYPAAKQYTQVTTTAVRPSVYGYF